MKNPLLLIYDVEDDVISFTYFKLSSIKYNDDNNKIIIKIGPSDKIRKINL
jgi:hypothetical protein